MANLAKIIASAILAFVLGSSAASAADCSRARMIFQGNSVSDFDVPEGCPGISRNLAAQVAKPACPHGYVILEAREATAATGGVHTQEQKGRGDHRWHLKCDWNWQSKGPLTQAPPAPERRVTAPPPAEDRDQPRRLYGERDDREQPRRFQNDGLPPGHYRARYVGEEQI